MARPVVFAVGGSDSSGGAGIQADTRTIHALGAHACTIVTAVTAQNSRGVQGVWPVPPDSLQSQWHALTGDLSPSAIKIGMVPSADHGRALAAFPRHCPIILDPVLRASAGGELGDVEAARMLLPHVDIVTPNLDEARMLLGRATLDSIEDAACAMAALGPSTVIIKGGHDRGPLAQDCVLHNGRILWLSSGRITSSNTHGTGCTSASAIAACIASGRSVIDAVVIAKMFVTNAIRNGYEVGSGSGPVAQAGWPEDEADLPGLTPSANVERPCFPRLDRPLGLYAIVDSAGWIERLAGNGVGALQLRIKGSAPRDEIARAIRVAGAANVPLFINDHWREAIELGAFGVHLGQEDLESADVAAIARAGLRLGISTHCYEEVARAHALRPSYIAVGPIFETKIKVMKFAPQGVQALRRWRRTLASYHLVAIGGIDASTISEVASTGVESIAVIRAITQAADPLAAVRKLAGQVRAAAAGV